VLRVGISVRETINAQTRRISVQRRRIGVHSGRSNVEWADQRSDQLHKEIIPPMKQAFLLEVVRKQNIGYDNKRNVCVNSSFHRDVYEICAHLGYYAAQSGNSVPTFLDNISVPPSRVKKSKKTLEDGTHKSSRNVRMDLPLYAA
jgi:acetyltransferase-like isoleucine patch superfamily enzyme